jgi:hypothetical protein
MFAQSTIPEREQSSKPMGVDRFEAFDVEWVDEYRIPSLHLELALCREAF